MAKKARRKLEEEEEAAFEFPVFDEVGFVTKEFELGAALAIAGGFSVLLGLLSWVITGEGLSGVYAFVLGILVLILTPFAIGRLRSRASLFTKGDWAGLLAFEAFAWLALWFVLTNVSPTL